MGLFSKKETLIRSIPLMGLMAAINVIFSVITTFVPLPFISVILVIFIPLTSTIVEIYCKDRYFPIYALATLGLSIVVSLSAIDFTLFYLIPSIATGYIFGLMAKRNFSNLWAVFIAAVLQTCFSFAFIPLIKLITQRDLIEDIRTIFGVSKDNLYFQNLIICLFFIVALVQTTLSFIVVDNELRKFGAKSELKSDWRLPVSLCALASAGFAVLFYFVFKPLCTIFVAFSLYFAVFCFVFEIKRESKISAIPMLIAAGINVFLFAILIKYVEKGAEFVLLTFTPGIVSLVSLGFFVFDQVKKPVEVQ